VFEGVFRLGGRILRRLGVERLFEEGFHFIVY
jgi:hypothetical protein